MNSRAKGCRGELQVRDLLRSYGFEAERGQQHAGGADSPDVVHSIPDVHVEVKYDERAPGALWKWMAQAVRDCGKKLPVVFWRRNRTSWLVTMRAEDFLRLKGGEKY